jgi:hypothetical protein
MFRNLVSKREENERRKEFLRKRSRPDISLLLSVKDFQADSPKLPRKVPSGSEWPSTKTSTNKLARQISWLVFIEPELKKTKNTLF